MIKVKSWKAIHKCLNCKNTYEYNMSDVQYKILDTSVFYYVKCECNNIFEVRNKPTEILYLG